MPYYKIFYYMLQNINAENLEKCGISKKEFNLFKHNIYTFLNKNYCECDEDGNYYTGDGERLYTSHEMACALEELRRDMEYGISPSDIIISSYIRGF